MQVNTLIQTKREMRVSVSNCEGGDVYLSIMVPWASCCAFLNREETQKLIDGLQAILDEEVPA